MTRPPPASYRRGAGPARYGIVSTRSAQNAAPGPHRAAAAATLASLARSPLAGYVRLAARYGDTIQVPYSPGRNFFLLTRPDQAEHVLAVNHTPDGIEGPVGRIVAGRRAAARAADSAGRFLPPANDPAAHCPPATTGPATRGEATTGPGHHRPGHHPDLLDVLLGARAEDGSPLTDAEIADEVATFMLAGHETTANTLCWTLALLSAYPSARQQLEDELETALGDRDPEADDAQKLPWTRAVVAEAMRLYPPAWTIERDALADDEVCDVPIPAC